MSVRSHEAPSARLGISNQRQVPHAVHVEPWAIVYVLSPREELEIVASGTEDVPWFHIVEWEGNTQVYCERTSTFNVTQAGRELPYGYTGRDAQPANVTRHLPDDPFR